MSNKKFMIYAHVNKINGKIYIGQTSCTNPNDRWVSGKGYKGSTHFFNAIQKYGWDNFEHIILFTNLSLDMANIIEIELIKKYKSTDSKYGYNIEFGGRNSLLSEETKKKISKACIGRKLSEETRLKISKATSGENNPYFGKHHSAETRKKMSENHWDCSGKNHYLFGKHIPEETKQKLREANLGENNYWYGKHRSEESKDKVRQKILGIKRSEETKQKIKNNHADFSGKNHPRYGKHLSSETKEKLSISCSTPVNMYDLDDNYIKKFYGMSEAQRETRANYMGISRCCSGKQKTCGGYKWKLAE